MNQTCKRLYLLLIFVVVSVNIMAEPIDSTVWTMLKGKKSPITISYKLPREWRSPSTECGIGNVGDAWTFPLICGMKLTAFKKEVRIYDRGWIKDSSSTSIFGYREDPNPPKTKAALERAQSFFAGYGCTVGGNWDEHWEAYENHDGVAYIQEKAMIKELAKPAIRNAVWLFIEPALGYQIKSMDIRYRGVVVTTFEYVLNYFGPNYNVSKAKAWYLKDKQNHLFAQKDYLGAEHPARKVTAMIERFMFKWEICDIGVIKSWLAKTSKWLKNLLGSDYESAKAYWN